MRGTFLTSGGRALWLLTCFQGSALTPELSAGLQGSSQRAPGATRSRASAGKRAREMGTCFIFHSWRPEKAWVLASGSFQKKKMLPREENNHLPGGFSTHEQSPGAGPGSLGREQFRGRGAHGSEGNAHVRGSAGVSACCASAEGTGNRASLQGGIYVGKRSRFQGCRHTVCPLSRCGGGLSRAARSEACGPCLRPHLPVSQPPRAAAGPVAGVALFSHTPGGGAVKASRGAAPSALGPHLPTPPLRGSLRLLCPRDQTLSPYGSQTGKGFRRDHRHSEGTGHHPPVSLCQTRRAWEEAVASLLVLLIYLTAPWAGRAGSLV